MYKINIYPEYSERRIASHLRRVRSGVLIGIVAIELLVVVALVTSGFLLAEQSRNVRAGVARLQDQIESGPSQADELATARAMVSLRRDRLDWSPKLAAISQTIDPSLAMTRISGELAAKKKGHQLTLDGRVRKGKPPMESVSGLLQAMRSDPRVSRDLASITLGNLRGGDREEFKVICTSKEAADASK